MNPLIGLTLLLIGATSPGTPITVNANCTYTTNATPASMTASKCIGVVSQISSSIDGPVYLTGGYKRKVKMPDGTWGEYVNRAADGMVVRFLHKSQTGDLMMLEGIQLSDGRVLVDGVPVERND